MPFPDGLPTYFALSMYLLKSVTYGKKAAFEHNLIHKKWGYLFEQVRHVRSLHLIIALQAGAKT